MNNNLRFFLYIFQYVPIVFFAFSMFYFFSDFRVSNDLESYLLLSQRIKGEDFSVAFSRELIEPTYLFMYWFLSNNLASIYVFTIAGLVPLTFKIFLLRKYLHYGVLAVIFYSLSYLHMHDTNAIRIGAASCIILYVIMQKNEIPNASIIFYSLIAASLHYSAIILLAMIFIKRIYIVLLGIFFISLIFEYFLTVFPIFENFQRYGNASETSISLTSPLFVFHSIIAFCLVFKWTELTHAQKKGAMFIFVGFLFYVFFLNYPVVSVRMRELGFLGIFPVLFSEKFRFNVPNYFIYSASLFYVFFLFTEVFFELFSNNI